MNERIKELADQCGLYIAYENRSVTDKELEAFAELIVREAARVVDIWSDEEPCSEGYDKFTVYKLKQHFGVE